MHADPALAPALPDNVVDERELRLALHHHHALLAEGAHDGEDGVLGVGDLVEAAVGELLQQPVEGDEGPAAADARAAVHDARVGRVVCVFLSAQGDEAEEGGAVGALGDEEVGPAAEEEVPYCAGVGVGVGAAVGRHVEFADLGAGFVVVFQGCEVQLVDEVVVVFVVGVESEGGGFEGLRVVGVAFLAGGFVGLGEHDDDGWGRGLVPDHAPEVRVGVVLGALSTVSQRVCGPGANRRTWVAMYRSTLSEALDLSSTGEALM